MPQLAFGLSMNQLLFYKQPVALNREQHGQLRFTPVQSFEFTRDINSVPLMGIEFFEASRDLPVFFSQDAAGSYFPLVLLSLMNNGHAQLDEKGAWQGNYIPAFIRRYPFALTDDGTVCFDDESAELSEETGDALFDEKGENSESLSNIINFLNQFDAENKRTQEFCAVLKDLGLLKPFTLQIMLAEEKPLRMDGLFVVDEEKLGQLEDEKVVALFRSAHLAWVYAHLHSLGALKQLMSKQSSGSETLQ